MSEPRKPDEEQEPDAGLQGLGDVSKAWRRASGEEPPAHVDDAILAASRRAVQAAPMPAGRRLPGTWIRSLSVAAVIVLGVAVTLSVYRQGRVSGVPASAHTEDLYKLSESALPTEGLADDDGPAMNAPEKTGAMAEKELPSASLQIEADAVRKRDMGEPVPDTTGAGTQPAFHATAPAVPAEPASAPAMKRILMRESVDALAARPDDSAREDTAQLEDASPPEPVESGALPGGDDVSPAGELAEIARLWNEQHETEALAALRIYLGKHPEIAMADLAATLPGELLARALAENAP